MNIIGLTGYAGAGKDTAAKELAAHGWTRVAFADPVREGLLALDPLVWVPAGEQIETSDKTLLRKLLDAIVWVFTGEQAGGGYHMLLSALVKRYGWDISKRIPHVRELLQRYGTEAGRNIHGHDCWLKIAADNVDRIIADGGKVVVTDVRFENESMFILQRGGIVIGINRPGIGPVNQHQSERLSWVTTVVNDGTPEELGANVLEVIGIMAETSKSPNRRTTVHE